MSTGRSRRLLHLDVLRGVAILLVLGHHPPLELDSEAVGFEFFKGWARGGWVGVDLFFVLSGFLIGTLLLQEVQQTGKLDLKRFLIRRGFKIWPGYILFLVANSLHRLLRFPGPVTERLSGTWPNWLHIQNYTGYWGSPFSHTWSLAVEEHFYLLLPLVIWLFIRYSAARPSKGLVQVLLAVLLICPVFRVATALVFPEFNFWIHQAPSHLRMDSLAAGVLLAWAVQHYPEKLGLLFRFKSTLLVLGLVFLSPAFFVPREFFWMHTLGFTVESFGSVLLVLWGVAQSRSTVKLPCWSGCFASLLAYVGLYSYSIYLWHEPYGQATVLRLTKLSPVELPYGVTLIVFIIVSLVLGVASYRLVETPSLRMRERFFPTLFEAAQPLPKAELAEVSTPKQG